MINVVTEIAYGRSTETLQHEGEQLRGEHPPLETYLSHEAHENTVSVNSRGLNNEGVNAFLEGGMFGRREFIVPRRFEHASFDVWSVEQLKLVSDSSHLFIKGERERDFLNGVIISRVMFVFYGIKNRQLEKVSAFIVESANVNYIN